MRIGLPLIGYAIAFEGNKGCSDDYGPSLCGVGALVVGAIVGISAVGFDAAFASETFHAPEQARSSFAPHIVICAREARLGLVGSF